MTYDDILEVIIEVGEVDEHLYGVKFTFTERPRLVILESNISFEDLDLDLEELEELGLVIKGKPDFPDVVIFKEPDLVHYTEEVLAVHPVILPILQTAAKEQPDKLIEILKANVKGKEFEMDKAVKYALELYASTFLDRVEDHYKIRTVFWYFSRYRLLFDVLEKPLLIKERSMWNQLEEELDKALEDNKLIEFLKTSSTMRRKLFDAIQFAIKAKMPNRKSIDVILRAKLIELGARVQED